MSGTRVSQSLEVRAEILKLARLLGREPEEFSYLEPLTPRDLRQLREQVTEVLFDANLGALKRLAAASRLLPVALVAQMGERVFGPLLSARIAGLLDPDRAVEMASRLPDAFLADVAIELDPRRASAVIARIPPQRIAAVSRELVARGEYVTMGRFVGHLPAESIRASLGATEPVDTLQVALVLENKEGLEDLLDLLGPERLEEMIAAAQSAGLQLEALELLDLLPEARRREIAAIPALQERLAAHGFSELPSPAERERARARHRS